MDCNGYYELEEGESPDDFEDCQCGGKLVYVQILGHYREAKRNARMNERLQTKLEEINGIESNIKGSKKGHKRKKFGKKGLLSRINIFKKD